VARADSNQEAMARIDMLLSDYDQAVKAALAAQPLAGTRIGDLETPDESDQDRESSASGAPCTWDLASRDIKASTPPRLEHELGKSRVAFAGFSDRLSRFLASYYPSESFGPIDVLKVHYSQRTSSL
jgi:hypothetical protein